MRAEPLVPILLVEDDEIDTEVVQRFLKRSDVPNPLYTARDGVEALDILMGRNGREKLPQPCVMLVDINMPRLNGLMLLREMRSSDSMKRNVVFILTTSDREEDIQAAYELNAAGYVLKKNADSLLGILGEYCRVNRLPSSSTR